MKLNTLTLICALALTVPWDLTADTLSGRVVRVIDGDTLVLLVSGNLQEKIRLAGIDCPERKQAFGQRAKQALLDRVASKNVSIEWRKRDRYDRIVGKIIDDQGDVNLALVRQGMCWWYKKYAKEQSKVDRNLYEQAEIKAREAGIGLWSDPHSIEPWEWRRKKRK